VVAKVVLMRTVARSGAESGARNEVANAAVSEVERGAAIEAEAATEIETATDMRKKENDDWGDWKEEDTSKETEKQAGADDWGRGPDDGW